jgi:hypothetical protein
MSTSLRACLSLVALLLSACAASPPATPKASPSPRVDPVREIGIGQLTAGRYTSSAMQPRIELSVPDGWQTFHASPEFFDAVVVRGDATFAVMFFRPTRIMGPPEGATFDDPRDVIALLHQNEHLSLSMERAATIRGIGGIEVDVTADRGDTQILGGDDGNLLGIGPPNDVRLLFLPIDRSVLVIGLISPDGLMDAWAAEARPVLSSISIELAG